MKYMMQQYVTSRYCSNLQLREPHVKNNPSPQLGKTTQ